MDDNQNTNQNANTGANNEPAGASNQNTGTNNAPVTFDNFLKDVKNQAEFDRRVQQALKTNADTMKEQLRKQWELEQNDKISEAEKLSKMNETEKLRYQLQKQQKDYENIQKKLNGRDLKDEGIKIATNPETAFDPEFLNLFKFEDMTAEELKEKTKLIKTIQDRIVEKAINEWSKEKPPYNPNPNNNSNVDAQVSQIFGN